MLRFYNFLSRKVEEFKPIESGEVGLYTCGPTVYDYVHIGNWRTFVFEDILKRVLKFNGYKVKHVMNITDIDDKIIKRAEQEGKPFGQITREYEDIFKRDLDKLNIIPADSFTRATEYIPQMIKLISKLLDNGVAYKGDDGIYFSVEKFKDYGKLSGLDKKNLKKGARVASDEYDKESWTDFALWKFKREGEPSWESPFGAGRPGWHIECSAMSMEELGESFDIHTGGVDLLFPHHENEIAQSEGATGKKFVKFWLEGEHLLVEGQKMSKSLGNIHTLENIDQWTKHNPLALRYLFLTAHYRSKLNFTEESLKASWLAMVHVGFDIGNLLIGDANEKDGRILNEFIDKFQAAINDDLDMPRAISVFHELLKSDKEDADVLVTALKFDEVLGLGIQGTVDDKRKLIAGGDRKRAEELSMKREELRKQGKFEDADKLRAEVENFGFAIEDTSEGPVLKLKEND